MVVVVVVVVYCFVTCCLLKVICCNVGVIALHIFAGNLSGVLRTKQT